MTRTILAALLLSACTAAPHRDWCDQPCHADVLLDLANAKGGA